MSEFRRSLFIVGRNGLLFADFSIYVGIYGDLWGKVGKSLGPEVFMCVG